MRVSLLSVMGAIGGLSTINQAFAVEDRIEEFALDKSCILPTGNYRDSCLVIFEFCPPNEKATGKPCRLVTQCDVKGLKPFQQTYFLPIQVEFQQVENNDGKLSFADSPLVNTGKDFDRCIDHCPLPEGTYLNSCTDIESKLVINNDSKTCLFSATCSNRFGSLVRNEVQLPHLVLFKGITNNKGHLQHAAQSVFSSARHEEIIDASASRRLNTQESYSAGNALSSSLSVLVGATAAMRFLL